MKVIFCKIMSDLKRNIVFIKMMILLPTYLFARYAYNCGLCQKQYPGPWKLNNKEIKSFAMCLQKMVTGYDKFLNKSVLTLWEFIHHQVLKMINFIFILSFTPLRHGDKPKVLAGSESLAGVFIMDVLPEYSASKLGGYEMKTIEKK